MSKESRFQNDLKKYEISLLTPTESVIIFCKYKKKHSSFFSSRPFILYASNLKVFLTDTF